MAESRRDLAPGLEDEVAATGAAEIDQALGGLFWGDSVVFEVAPGATVAPFYRAVAASNVAYDQCLFIVLEGASATYPGFDLIDATPNSKLAEPAPLLHAVFERCQGSESTRTKSDPVPYERRPTTPILRPPMHSTGRDGRPAPAAN